MNIEIKYQAEDGEIRYYHFESWEPTPQAKGGDKNVDR